MTNPTFHAYYNFFKGKTQKEVSIFHLETLKVAASLFKINGYSKMNKDDLSIKIVDYLNIENDLVRLLKP